MQRRHIPGEQTPYQQRRMRRRRKNVYILMHYLGIVQRARKAVAQAKSLYQCLSFLPRRTMEQAFSHSTAVGEA
jgi:hypothetical protein